MLAAAARVLLVAVVFYMASGGGTSPASLGTTEVTLDCAWTTGDGIGEGGSEEYLGDTPTRKDCVNKVRREATGANGATYSQTTGACTDERGCMRCYAEYGLTATNGNSDWQTCTLAGAISFNPVPPDWTVEGCDWVAGDGLGGTEVEIPTEVRDMAHCVEEVKQMYPMANGATGKLSADF